MEKQVNLQIEIPADERQYIMSPHPTACVPVCEESVNPDEPIIAEKSLSELVERAVEELRVELQAELETQVRRVQNDLQAELQSEIQRERGLENDAQIKKP